MHFDRIKRPSSRVVMQKGLSKSNVHKVALVSGGGAGHEPFAAGFVGKGMLTASVAGDLFSSPSTRSIESAIHACLDSGYESVLLLVNNYTGDRLTFSLAQRRNPQTSVQIIADDCTTKHLRIGARGLPGNLFHYKIAGAMAERGATLAMIKEELDSLSSRVQTIGACIQACTMPGKTGHILEIEPGYVELGLGVHGEAGIEKVKVSSCDDLVASMLVKLLESLENERKSIPNDRLALLVNNLGGMSQVEMSLVARAAVNYLYNHYSVKPIRLYVGTYMTSLDAKGFTLSLFLANSDVELEYLDAETDAPVWVPSYNLPPLELLMVKPKEEYYRGDVANGVVPVPEVGGVIAKSVRRICHRVTSMTDRLNFLDGGGMGDGDTGSSLSQMYNKLLADIDAANPNLDSPTSLESLMNYLYYASRIAESEMGGTSGGLYAFALHSCADALKTYVDGESKAETELDIWCDIIDSALWAVQFLGGAQPGDRSIVDPIDAIANVVDAAKQAKADNVKSVLLDSVVAAQNAAEATAEMRAHVGRAAAARDFATKQPDAGATAIAALWAELIASLYPSA